MQDPATVDEFVIWLLANVPKFDQGSFRELGLHEPVLQLLDSRCDAARVYAAQYARFLSHLDAIRPLYA